MGKLRDNIVKLHQTTLAIEKMSKEVAEQADKLVSNQNNAFNNGVRGGVEVLYLYLNEKFTKQKQTYAAHEKDKLEAHKDANVLKFMAGIEQGKKNTLAQLAAWDAFDAAQVRPLAKTVDVLLHYLKETQGQLASKKKKLFQSRKYKDKIALYEKAVVDLAQRGAKLKDTVDKVAPDVTREQFADVVVTGSTTLKQLNGDILISVNRELTQIARSAAAGKLTRRKLREEGNVADGRDLLKAWVDEADEMEAEAEGNAAAANDKLQIGAIVLTDLSFKKPVAKAKGGVWDPEAKTLSIAGLQWGDAAKLGRKPLDYLQVKMALSGVQLADKSVFRADLKLVKLAGGLDKADFKG